MNRARTASVPLRPVGPTPDHARSWWSFVPFSTLVALIVVDLGLLMISLLRDPPGRWETSLDGGNLEIYGYVKLTCAIALLVAVHRLTRQRPYASVAVVLGIVVADDAVGVHENVGAWIVDAVSIEVDLFGLRPFDLAQLAVFAVIGILCAAALVVGSRSGDLLSRSFLRLFVGLLAALFVFAVGLDMLHRATVSGLAERMLAYLEDGGEQFVISGMLGLALAARRRLWRGTVAACP